MPIPSNASTVLSKTAFASPDSHSGAMGLPGPGMGSDGLIRYALSPCSTRS